MINILARLLLYCAVFILLGTCSFAGEKEEKAKNKDPKSIKISWDLSKGKCVFVGYQENHAPVPIKWNSVPGNKKGTTERTNMVMSNEGKPKPKDADLKLYPLIGISYPKSAKSKRAQLTLEFPRPIDGKTTFNDDPQQEETSYKPLSITVKEDGLQSTVGFKDTKKGKMEFVKPIKLLVPLNIKGVELYTVPYMKINGIVKCVLVVVANDTKKIEKIVTVSKSHKKFNWGKWFDKVR